ncbi:phosphatidylinositol 3 and 4-kinase-domain-containing protein [Protomyces lactucae-debilis]|uniref:Phosphatidylinositol 4-kinase n=1 Tax=Protomyces lactucae-debilis TaxID=2754530 RepID=A0A1Y2FSE3_PROLT|nr:phosphatidylinositol 3 and 4-kinase-domain-containing protein [Protomyces lactucae-debilis]ORY86106.1 phosphatidylinositol 3 and 4-kinase-domain-containing protein [Protomyces lactucae-debilis]
MRLRDQGDEEDEEDNTVLDNIVDLKQINARLQDWFHKIKVKQSSSAKNFDRFAAEIHTSVFTPKIEPVQSSRDQSDSKSMSAADFDAVIDSVRSAISSGIQPRLVTKGSSGSYFAINRQQKVVGIFKPKNEEPYGQLNPKWTKWLHRNLFPCFFGRSCLIPNLSYISEAAACLLDRQLKSNIVPPTDVVWLASTSFNYDYFDRRAYVNKGKPLPAKQGSFQVFLEGFQDATEFLKEHPWPDAAPQTASVGPRRSWTSCVGSKTDEDDLMVEELQNAITTANPRSRQFWTPELMQSMREELEKLVILDYIMRNTDRGLDNWMLKMTPATATSKAKVEMVASTQTLQTDIIDRPPSRTSMPSPDHTQASTGGEYMSLGAIDNSLAFPWKHPDEWRSFPFGWLFLPASLIGQPFSAKTRQHFLPLLSDPAWWSDTTSKLKGLFSQDADYQEKMFAKQMAVLKGQAWNVLETLKSGDQGPLELARRPRLHVWTDIMEVPVTVASKKASKASAPPQEGIKKQAIFHEFADEIDLGMVGDLPDFNGQSSKPAPLASSLPNKKPSMELARSSSDYTGRSSFEQGQRPQQMGRGASRASIDGSKPGQRTRARGLSLGMKSGANRFGGDEESDLGDLGYALMHEEEASTRQVVVERLETVHGAEAVFSWC